VAAQHAGYVDEIVGPEELLPRSLEVARHFAQLDPTSYGRTKRAMRSNTASALHSALERRRGAVDN